MAKAQNLFDTAKNNLDAIAQLLESDYSDKKRLHKAINILKRPQNILKKKLIFKLSNGKKKVSQSFRIEHCDSNGQYLGGIRYTKNINEEDIKGLAILESIKSSIVDAPFGGAFGGVDIDPKKATDKDLERVTKLYSQFLTSHIGAWKDVMTTERGSNQKTLYWMMEAYEKKKKHHSPATFVGNRFNLDGAATLFQEYLRTVNYISRFRKLDVAVYGFGSRSILFINNLIGQNFRIVALSDSTGGIVNSSGFDIQEIEKLKSKFTTLKEVSVMQKIEFIENEKLLKLPVDVLIIASREHSIDEEIAKNIKSKLVLELSNFGITNEGQEILSKNNIEVLPDILLNSGFSSLSHFDWIQKMHGYKWSREDLSKKLNTIMIKTFNEVKDVAIEKKTSYRSASYYLGLKRIIESMMLRGRV